MSTTRRRRKLLCMSCMPLADRSSRNIATYALRGACECCCNCCNIVDRFVVAFFAPLHLQVASQQACKRCTVAIAMRNAS